MLSYLVVDNLLQSKIFTNIESQVSSQSGIPAQNITLMQINNQPTFEVQGISQKKILGIIPVGFTKTAFVSATTGNVVKTDEAFLNRFLEALSF